MGIFYWLESSILAIWIGESLWGYPIALTMHSIGMAVMVGIVLVIDLRVAGRFSSLSFVGLQRALKLAWCGFAINLISGFSLFSSQASYFATHTAFLIKIAAIFLAAINAYLLQKLLTDRAASWDQGIAVDQKAKRLAISSMLLWLVAIIAGRLIAYVGG